MGTLKRSQQIEKKKSAHLLEEARRREGDLNEDASQLKVNEKGKSHLLIIFFINCYLCFQLGLKKLIFSFLGTFLKN